MIILFLLQALTKRKTKRLYLLNIPLYIINIPLPPSSPSSGHAFSLHFPCALHPLQGDKDDSGLLSAHSPPTLESRPFTSSPTQPVQLHNTACFDMQCILMGIFRAEMVLKMVESQIWVRLTHFILVGSFVSLLRVHAVKCVSREAQDNNLTFYTSAVTSSCCIYEFRVLLAPPQVRPHGTTPYCSDLLTDGGCVALLVVGFLLVTPLLVLALAAYCRLARHLQLGLCFIPYSRAVYKNLPATRHRGLGTGCCGGRDGADGNGKGKVWV